MEDPTTVPPPVSTSTYVWAAVSVVLIGTLAIFGIFVVRPDRDNSAIITIIIAGIAPTAAAILGLMKAQETHLVVNSRFDKVIGAATAVAREEGAAAERARAAITGSSPVPAVLPCVDPKEPHV